MFHRRQSYPYVSTNWINIPCEHIRRGIRHRQGDMYSHIKDLLVLKSCFTENRIFKITGFTHFRAWKCSFTNSRNLSKIYFSLLSFCRDRRKGDRGGGGVMLGVIFILFRFFLECAFYVKIFNLKWQNRWFCHVEVTVWLKRVGISWLD